MKLTLVIMAAGMGSRYQGGIKQLEAIGPNGESLMDYSIYDAVEAGFKKVVFVIRKDMEDAFQSAVGNRISKICIGKGIEVTYAFQELTDVPSGCCMPLGREKPWGTGAAVLAVRDVVADPFVVINADDYYGKYAFVRLAQLLTSYEKKDKPELCMAGFELNHTLSKNGGVTRGLCTMDAGGYLKEIVETKNIVYTDVGILAQDQYLDGHTLVSMNMWGMTPSFFSVLTEGFADFLNNLGEEELTAEFLLPIFIGTLLKENRITVKVEQTNDQWFGVTYKQDKEAVVAEFRKLIQAGVYQEDLFSEWQV